MSQQTRRLIGAATTIFLAVGFWYTWNDVLPAMEKLGTTVLYTIQDQDITLGAAVTALVVVILTVIVARNVPGLLEIVILRRLPLDRGVRFAIITVCRYILVIVGIVWAFSEIGIGWGKVQWLIAAMTVGLGFGLQEIFANFVSGLILLFEQPIRVDDVVTVGDVTGKVTMIHIRATTIRKWDQRELIVPNKEFITGRLINWTLSDNTLRRDFPVGIAYGSDIRKAERLLYEIAQADPRVLKDPPPTVLFKGFGDSSLDFELRVCYSGIDNNLPIWHDINFAIDDAFRQAGIEIAFPQRDVHIRSTSHEMPIDITKPQP
jgi:potassium efflux system protein